MKKIIFLLLVIVVTFNDSCKKDTNNDVVPKVFVDLYLNLSLPSYSVLNNPSNYVYISGGNRGIIVYRMSQQTFIALDRNCTYDSDLSTATVQVQGNNITAIDSACGSKFQITDGSVTNGPATRSLVRYNAVFDAGSNTLHIYN